MTGLTYLRAQAYNNAWANHRLLSACGQLSDAELWSPQTGFFPSILHTLNHILTVDWYYVSGLEGACIGAAAYQPEYPCTRIADLDREQRAVDRRLIAYCEALDEASLTQTITLPRPDWVQQEPADRVLMHLFQHQIHHRGQVHTMLSATRIAPPQLDEFYLGHEREQALRKDDFTALGFDEAQVWRD